VPRTADFPQCCGMQIIIGFTTVRLTDPDVPVGPPPVRFRPSREEVSTMGNRLVRRILRSSGYERILDSDKPVSKGMRDNAYNSCYWSHITPEGDLYRPPPRHYGKTLAQERKEVDEYLHLFPGGRGVTLIALNVYQVENIGDLVEAHGFTKVVTAGNPIHGSWKAPEGPRTVSLYIRNEQPEPRNDVPSKPRASILSRGV